MGERLALTCHALSVGSQQALIELGDYWLNRGSIDSNDSRSARMCYTQVQKDVSVVRVTFSLKAKDYHPDASQYSQWCLKISRTYLLLGDEDPRHFQRAMNFSAQVPNATKLLVNCVGRPDLEHNTILQRTVLPCLKCTSQKGCIT